MVDANGKLADGRSSDSLCGRIIPLVCLSSAAPCRPFPDNCRQGFAMIAQSLAVIEVAMLVIHLASSTVQVVP